MFNLDKLEYAAIALVDKIIAAILSRQLPNPTGNAERAVRNYRAVLEELDK